jgi:hypothetical protein
MEGLLRPNNRTFLEGLLKELTGSDWTLRLSLAEGLPPDAPRIETQPAPERPKSAPTDGADSFKNDPLIQEALEIFKGEIKSVTS